MDKKQKEEYIKDLTNELLVKIRDQESKVNYIHLRNEELLNKEQKELETLKLKHQAFLEFKVK